MEYEGTTVGQILENMKGMAGGMLFLGFVWWEVKRGKGVLVWRCMLMMTIGKAPGRRERRASDLRCSYEGMVGGMDNYLRLPLGKDGSAKWEIKLANLKANLDGTEKIWRSMDVDE